MPSAIASSALGAFQASFSVLLTLSYGVLASRLGIINSGTAKDVSSLCVNIFLPALLITKVGSEINTHNFTNYVPVFIWAFIYHAISLSFGKAAEKVLKLPSWVAPACMFNNTTSLPLLLTKSLMTTGILTSITGNDVAGAVDRSQSYFLINSMVSNTATFVIGPKLLNCDGDDDENEEEEASQQREEADENTSLLPKPITMRISSLESTASKHFNRLPTRLQSTLSYIASLLNPTLWGALISLFVGLTPSVHRALFANSQDGGWLNVWFTSSVRNIGDLFTSLQMFVVGTKLSDSLVMPKGSSSPCPPNKAIAIIFLVRFVFWGVFSIPIIYILATKTKLLGDDPMLWWSMM
jgi:predicted permease